MPRTAAHMSVRSNLCSSQPEKLVIKRVFGQALTGKDLVEFFLREAEKFAHADLPDVSVSLSCYIGRPREHSAHVHLVPVVRRTTH